MLEKIFDLKANGTSVRQELRAGLTSFMAMCYLIFVVPSMLADAGMPRESAVAAVIWVTIAITLLMGLWARFPVGVAPGLGITAFFAYYVCGPAGYSWQTGLGAVFISGVFFMLLTVTRVRQMIIDAVPMDLKYAIVVGIGAFIAFIGLKNCGIVVADPSTFVTLGPLTKPEALLALGGLALMAMLMCLGIFAGTGTTAFAAGETMTTYMVEFPRASDPNKAGWGHSAMNFLGGWSTGENNGFTIHRITLTGKSSTVSNPASAFIPATSLLAGARTSGMITRPI